jgi:hypothetical protein
VTGLLITIFISLFNKTDKHVEDDSDFYPCQGILVVCCIANLLTKTSEGAKMTFEISHCMFRFNADLFKNTQKSSGENEKLA